MTQVIKIKRTGVVDRAPVTLEDGELAAALANDPIRMWIGVGAGAVKELFAGAAVEDADDDAVYGRSNGDWVKVPIVEDGLPTDPAPNSLWWDSASGKFFLWYIDGATKQWVEIGSPGREGPRGATGPVGATGGTGGIGDIGATGASGLQGPPGAIGATGASGAAGAQTGVTDGSNAAPGEVGETLEWSRDFTQLVAWSGNIPDVCTITLPAGDWNLDGAVQVRLPQASDPRFLYATWRLIDPSAILAQQLVESWGDLRFSTGAMDLRPTFLDFQVIKPTSFLKPAVAKTLYVETTIDIDASVNVRFIATFRARRMR